MSASHPSEACACGHFFGDHRDGMCAVCRGCTGYRVPKRALASRSPAPDDAVPAFDADGEPIQYRGPAIPPSVEARDACPFTREDVELLTRCADGCDGTEDCEDDEPVFPDGIRMYMRDVKRLRSLVSRIASLLPPEKT